MEWARVLSKYKYAELRREQRRDSIIQMKDEEVRNSEGSASGMSVRVLEEGSWGFASGKEGDAEALLERAQRLARLSKGRISPKIPEAASHEVIEKTEPADSADKIRALIEASKEMKAAGISSRSISCTDSVTRKEFYNSLGAVIIQESGYTYLSCSAVARSGDNIQRGAERAWSRSGFGRIDLMKTAQEAREKALRLLTASAPPRGRFTVVLDPEMTGVFSHEAVGHACEADSVVERESVLADKLGKRIGNELVSIADDPAAMDFGHYTYDDEGVEAKRALLVEKGVLRGYMNSMETAGELGAELNGHARAEDYSAVPIVRMSNTYFQKGESAVDEVFAVQSGVYLKGMKGGSVDIFSGGFMFKAEEAYEIVKGEKGRLMRDVTITGNILQTLLEVECVGNDFGTSPGICGKFSQEAPVSDGGPHIRVRNVAIG
ncbi:MAG TPA: TldD/PmbA family protein [Candidatus Bilamarchaeum sp.]|nr:TldD/PmbA family protein [Candidatus Bilamarchaeum sp.]